MSKKIASAKQRREPVGRLSCNNLTSKNNYHTTESINKSILVRIHDDYRHILVSHCSNRNISRLRHRVNNNKKSSFRTFRVLYFQRIEPLYLLIQSSLARSISSCLTSPSIKSFFILLPQNISSQRLAAVFQDY